MSTRRAFLRYALTAAPLVPWAWPLRALGGTSAASPAATLTSALGTGSALRPVASAAARPLPVGAVIYDGRYEDARAFARALVRRGAVAFDARDDIVRLWRGPLRARLAAGAGCVAGLTTHSDFTLARASVRDSRLTLLQEGAHERHGACEVQHLLRLRADGANAAAAGVRPALLISWVFTPSTPSPP
ncbi:MAG: hypothetical protein WBE92_03020 [Steroidobacteraceae bacterium]